MKIAESKETEAKISQIKAQIQEEVAKRAEDQAFQEKRNAVSLRNKANRELKKTVALVLATDALKLNSLYGADLENTRKNTLAALLALEAFQFDRSARDSSVDPPQAGYFPEQIYDALQTTLSVFDPTASGSVYKCSQDWLQSVTGHPEGELLAAGGADHRVWAQRDQDITGDTHEGAVRAVVFSPGNKKK